MSYTIYPNNDKAQLDGNAITATSTNVQGGAISGLGKNTDASSYAKTDFAYAKTVHGSQVIQGSNVSTVYKANAVSLTSVANNSGTCRFTKATHGLSVGDVLSISGSTNGNVDGIHVITAKATNTFDTDVKYVASASPGSYRLPAGAFAQMEQGKYLIAHTKLSIAGGYKEFYTGGNGIVQRSINKLEAIRTARIITALKAGYWDSYSGSWTTKPTSADDISDWGTDSEGAASRANPGELVYRVSGQPGSDGLVQANYPAKT